MLCLVLPYLDPAARYLLLRDPDRAEGEEGGKGGLKCAHVVILPTPKQGGQPATRRRQRNTHDDGDDPADTTSDWRSGGGVAAVPAGGGDSFSLKQSQGQ